MRYALTRAAFARPVSMIIPKPAIFPWIRFSSTESSAKPYAVGLTSGYNYPVFDRIRGKNSFTIVKKIEGDNEALINDLVEVLGVPKDDVKFNRTITRVEVKGNHVVAIKDFLKKTFGDTAHLKPAESSETAASTESAASTGTTA